MNKNIFPIITHWVHQLLVFHKILIVKFILFYFFFFFLKFIILQSCFFSSPLDFIFAFLQKLQTDLIDQMSRELESLFEEFVSEVEQIEQNPESLFEVGHKSNRSATCSLLQFIFTCCINVSKTTLQFNTDYFSRTKNVLNSFIYL